MNYRTNILPQNQTYEQLLPAFAIPYFAYILLNFLGDVLPLAFVYLAKTVIVTLLLIVYRKSYQIGKISLRDIFYSALITPLLLLLWVTPFYFYLKWTNSFSSQTLDNIAHSQMYWGLRTVASVILVAIFEELFFRAYLLEFLHQAQSNDSKSIMDRCSNTLGESPQNLQYLPLGVYSVVGTLIIFALGHSTAEYISCFLYFGATLAMYRYLRSFWMCILTHAFTNLSIAILVKYKDMDFLWFG